MSLYKEKLGQHPCGKKRSRNRSRWRRWAKNQRNRMIRRSLTPETDVKRNIGYEY